MKIEAPRTPEDIINILKNVKIQEKGTGKMLSISKIHLEWKDEKGDGIAIDYPRENDIDLIKRR